MARGTRAGPAWPGAALALVAAVASAGVASAVWAVHDDGAPRTSSDPAAQVAAVEQACRQWTAADPAARTGLGGDDDRCAALTARLTDLARTGRSPWMTWGDPPRLLATCRSWLTETASSGSRAGDTGTWCDDLVGWMSTHPTGWSGSARPADGDDWLRTGPLTGP